MILLNFKSVDFPISMILVVCFISWFALSTIFSYGSVWISIEILQGCAKCPRVSHQYHQFQDGTRYSSLGFSILALVATLFGGIATHLSAKYPLHIPFCFGQLGVTICCLVAPFIKNIDAAVFLIGLSGLTWGAMQSMPYLWLGRLVSSETRAAMVGIMWMSILGGQICSYIVASLFLSVGLSYSWLFFIAGCLMLFTLFIVGFYNHPSLRLPPSNRENDVILH